MKYRKKPVVIEAFQYTAPSGSVRGLCQRLGCTHRERPHVHTIHPSDDGLGQAVFLAPGDWIIPEPDGEHFYPCKPDIFAETYEAVDEVTSAPAV